jgi:hypothetical protein
VKVWFQNRRTKHKREQQEQEQQQQQSKGGGKSGGSVNGVSGSGDRLGRESPLSPSASASASMRDFALTHAYVDDEDDEEGITDDEEIDCDS